MVGKLKNRKESGFTIIEVLIVLAIAGLIMLVVFLAVPNLQRNSRDSQRRSDVTRVLGAAQEVLNNSNGSLSGLTTAKLNTAVGSYAYYSSATVTAMASGVASGSGINSTDEDSVVLYTAAKCDGTTGKAISGTSRQLAVVYKLESGSGTIQCTNS